MGQIESHALMNDASVEQNPTAQRRVRCKRIIDILTLCSKANPLPIVKRVTLDSSKALLGTLDRYSNIYYKEWRDIECGKESRRYFAKSQTETRSHYKALYSKKRLLQLLYYPYKILKRPL